MERTSVPSSRTERRPLLRRVSPRPVSDDDQLSESEAHYAHEHDTTHARPPKIIAKIIATCFSFLVLGLMVSTTGLVVVSPLGYLAGALLNGPIHRRLGQRGIVFIAPVFQISMVILAAGHYGPPNVDFKIFLIIATVGTFGHGLLHVSWSAWAGGLDGRRNAVQGLLHGSYAVGVGLGLNLSAWGSRWWQWWYTVLLGVAILQGLLLCWAFRFEDGRRYREDSGRLRPSELHGASEARLAAHHGRALGYAVTWICAAYFFVYVAMEAGMTGWIAAFMSHVRHAPFHLGVLSTSGFWFGMAAGRILLGLATDKLGVRRTTPFYLVLAIVCQCVFVLVDRVVVSVVAAILFGFFSGPLYPSGMVIITGLLPRELHVGAVSFVAFVGQLGATLGAFTVPMSHAWANSASIPLAIILAILVVILLIWLFLSRLPGTQGESRDSTETAHENPDVAG